LKESPTQIVIFSLELLILVVLYFLISNDYKSYFYFFFLSFIELVRTLFEAKISNLNFAVKHSIFFYCIFILILVRNLFGMNFEVYTITSFINEPFFFSFTFLIGIFFLSIKNFGFKFIAGFTPSNTPVGILPFLLLIEIASYLTRLISVALRLFINMIAGHALLKIFITIS
jgi:F0F1-type ATP synthase membrane subunit a